MPENITAEELGLSKELGKITEAFLGYEDHGIFSFALTFDFGGTVQELGPIGLGEKGKFAGQEVSAILRALNVSSWDEVKGKTAYALRNKNGLIVGIEGVPFENGKRYLVGGFLKELQP